MTGGAKKTALQAIAIVLTVIVLVAAIYYMMLAFTIRRTIIGFKEACSEFNVMRALEYIDPVEARFPILVSAGAVEAYQKISGDEGAAKKVVTSVVNVFLGTDLEEEELSGFLKSLRYSRVLFLPGWKSCGIRCLLHYKVGGQELEKKMRIRFVNRDGDWYIYSINI